MENKIKNIIIEKGFHFDNYDNYFNELGVDSISFLNIVISTCSILNIDFMKLNNTNLSVEISIKDYIQVFKELKVETNI